jgi:hypothetical protein
MPAMTICRGRRWRGSVFAALAQPALHEGDLVRLGRIDPPRPTGY